MQSTKAKYRIAKQTTEDKKFWQKHIAAHAASGISKIAYCRINQVDHARFTYWSKKESLTHAASPLVAVKLQSVSAASSNMPLCTLTMKNGCCLSVHDERVLSLILDKLG